MTSAPPRTSIRFRVGTQIFAAFVLLVCVNYFSFNHYGRGDFSRSQKFVLADQTKSVIKQMKKPARITVFFSPTLLTPESQLFPDVQNLLKELLFSGREKIEVEYVNPTRDLSRARELQSKFKFGNEENLLIVEYDGRSKFVPIMDMADFDLTPIMSGDAPRLVAFKGEQAITNALLGLVDPLSRKAYFLQGHGEPTIEGLTQLSVLKDYVERQNVKAESLSFSSSDTVPADSGMVVIVSPKFDFDDREVAILKGYWRSRGRLLVLLDPNAKTPKLNAFLAEAGITPRDDRILRTVKLPFAMGILRDVTAVFLPNSEITKRLAGTNLLLPGASQSLSTADTKEIKVRTLLQAGEEFWAETDYVTDEKKGVRYDEGRDTGYPVYVAAVADRGGVEDDRVEVQSAKMIVVGSAGFAYDAALSQQGLDFLLSAMNSLLERGKLAGVMPKSTHHFILNLTDAQSGSITFYTMVLIPGAAAALGLIAWWRRRN